MRSWRYICCEVTNATITNNCTQQLGAMVIAWTKIGQWERYARRLSYYFYQLLVEVWTINNFNMPGEISKRRKKIRPFLHVDMLSGQTTWSTMLIMLVVATIVSHAHAEKIKTKFKLSEMHNVSRFQRIGSRNNRELFSN